jgi:CDP-diacylglycerol--serine O-phosphatidyltransferase
MKLHKSNTINDSDKKEGENYNSHELKLDKLSIQPSMISFAFDLPNICTLTGLLSAFLGIYFAIQGNIYFAVIGGLWAVLFDWLDGLIASKMKGRTDDDRSFGAQMDSLIDIVSFGVLPAIILLSYTNYSLWSIIVGFAIIAGCAIRLSYFNIYGLTGGKTYTGLAVDFNGLIVSFAFLFEIFFTKASFSIGLTILLMIVVVLNLSSIQIPKFSKKWLFAIAAYVIGMTIYLGRM